MVHFLDEVMPLSLATLEEDPRQCLRGAARHVVLGQNDDGKDGEKKRDKGKGKGKGKKGNDDEEELESSNKDSSEKEKVTDKSAESELSNAAVIKFMSPIFNRHRFVVRLVGLLGLMLSFGIIFPPLAVVIAIAIMVTIWFEQLNIGRILTEAESKGFLWYYDKLAYDLEHTADSLLRALLPMTCMVCLLFTALLFDTFGDRLGATVAFIAIGLFQAVLIFLWLVLVRFRDSLPFARILESWWHGHVRSRKRQLGDQRNSATLSRITNASIEESDVELRTTTVSRPETTSVASNPMHLR
jgi:hypothetical protein